MFGDYKQKGEKSPLFSINTSAKHIKQMEEQWVIDLRKFKCDEPNPSEFITTGSWNSGTKGLTTCPQHQKESNRKCMLERYANGFSNRGANNGRAKTWRIVYEDGREIIIGGLQRWAVDNGYSASGIKKIAYGHWKRYRDLVTVEEVAQGAS